MMDDATRYKWISFTVLIIMHTAAYLTFKAVQSDGHYTFSPASSVTFTEALKLVLALTLHQLTKSTPAGAKKTEPAPPLSRGLVWKSALLATMYTANNIMTFYALEWADPGTLILFKSLAPFLCALLLRFTGQSINTLQWSCIFIHCLALVTVQYDACKKSLALEPRVYALLLSSVCVTAMSSVWNQLVLKSYETPIHVQNAILYSFGIITSASVYFILPQKRGFLEGYNKGAFALIMVQASYGITVSFAYKFADVLIKNMSNAVVVGALCIVSAVWFNVPTSVDAVLATLIILTTTYIYMTIATNPKFKAFYNDSHDRKGNYELVRQNDTDDRENERACALEVIT